MAHVAQRSPSLWVHVGCCWVFTAVTFLLLQHHTKQLVALRLKLLARSQQARPPRQCCRQMCKGGMLCQLCAALKSSAPGAVRLWSV